MGLGFTFALLLVATVREIIGNGTFCGISLFGSGYAPALLLVMPAGAFLTLGFVIAAVQKVRSIVEERARLKRIEKEAEIEKEEGTV